MKEDTTKYSESCRHDDHCTEKGYSYYWCYTRDSWDYCSPVVTNKLEIYTRIN